MTEVCPHLHPNVNYRVGHQYSAIRHFREGRNPIVISICLMPGSKIHSEKAISRYKLGEYSRSDEHHLTRLTRFTDPPPLN